MNKKIFLVFMFCILALLVGCKKENEIYNSDQSENGTYFSYTNGELDKTNYFILNSGEWTSSNNLNGIYRIDEEKIIIYIISSSNEKEELDRGTISNETLELEKSGIYYKEGYGPSNDNQNQLIYQLNDDQNSYTVIGVNDETIETISIPEKYNNLPVTSIGDYAFSDCFSLKSIYIPSNIKTIGEEPFYLYSSLVIYCEKESKPEGWNFRKTFYMVVYWGITKEDIIEQDSMQFLVKNNEAIITKYTGDNEIITIPESIIYNGKTYDVTTIGEYAFLYFDSLTITSIYIPSSITTIGDNAFGGGKSLVIYCEAGNKPNGWSYKWNNGVLPGDSCSVCWGIKKGDTIIEQDGIYFHIKDNEAIIKVYTGDSESITIPESIIHNGKTYNVTTIGDNAFSDCLALTSINIPSSVTTIGDNAFSDCLALTSINIPSSVTTIGDNAFSDCLALRSIYIPSSVRTIGNHVFRSLTIYCEVENKPDGWDEDWRIITTNKKVYWGIAKENIIEQDGIQFLVKENEVIITKYIGNSKRNITIPESITYNGKTCNVTTIGDFAFSDCFSLKSIYIPSNIKTIGEEPFDLYSSLVIYCEVESKPDGWGNWGRTYYGIKKGDIIEQDGIQFLVKENEVIITKYIGNSKNVIIPETITYNGKTYEVTTVGNYAFYDCLSLAYIYIPSSVTTIGYHAFGGSKSLVIYCEAESKLEGWDENWYSGFGRIYWGITREDIKNIIE